MSEGYVIAYLNHRFHNNTLIFKMLISFFFLFYNVCKQDTQKFSLTRVSFPRTATAHSNKVTTIVTTINTKIENMSPYPVEAGSFQHFSNEIHHLNTRVAS